MLERVSPSAECATQALLRHFELPIRSNRILGPTFWRANGDKLDVPVWWPSYLERFKIGTDAQHGRVGGQSTFRARSPFDRICLRTGQTQQAGLSSLSEVAREDADELPEVYNQPDEPEIHTQSKQTSRPNPFASFDGTHDTPQTAWARFVRTGQNPNHASPLLQLLANSSEQRDLKLAITAYNFIPSGRRTVEDFRAAVKVATSLRYYTVAIGVIKDALLRHVGQDVFFKFLAYCVQNTLWNTAADLWKEAGSPHQKTLHFAAHHAGSRSGNLVGRFITDFDIVDDLPSKVIRLADRLGDHDPILTSRRHDLVYLCRKLAYLVADSPKCMNTIDLSRLKALFSVQKRLGLDLKLHSAAMRTINRMSDKGAKSQTAKFIFSDFKIHYKNIAVPQWMYGTLISIYSAGNESSGTYLSLFEDYKKAHGEPDHLFHTQVLRACVNQGEINEARTIFQDRYRDTPPKNVDDVNLLVRAYAVVGDYVNAQLQFDKIVSEFDLRPDVRSWNELLLAYARSNTPKQAFTCFEAMKRSPVQPNQYTWTILVGVTSKRGDTNHARRLLREAENAGFSPPLPMIGAIVDSCLFNDEPSEAIHLVIQATLQNTNASPIRLWNSLFRYYAFKADSDAILHTQQTMRRFNVEPDGMTYATLMTALVVQNRTREAVQILRTLHFSKAISVTMFHYSILIHGFAKEKNIDAATLVYHEMLERFSRTTPSARLAMLYVSAQRAEENVVKTNSKDGFQTLSRPDFGPTLNLLSETLEDVRLTDKADSKPSPGFRRRSVRNDMESSFLSSLVSLLQRHDTEGNSEEIIDLITKGQKTSEVEGTWTSRLQHLSLKLSSSIQLSKWGEVDKLWDEALVLTLQSCSSFQVDNPEPANDMNTFRDMIPRHLTNNPLNHQILPAYRFVLSRQVSHYFMALSRQQSQMTILPLIEKLQNHGLQMSGKNWNTAILAFCRSSDSDHHVLAYELFEKHMIPNIPRWRSLTRGLSGGLYSNRKRRAIVEKGNPELCLPTYFTVVHLATILLSYYRSLGDKAKAVRSRLKLYPGTFRFVRGTPYMRDRVQGMLLRNRQTIGDPYRRPRHPDLPRDLAKTIGLRSTLPDVPEALTYETKKNTMSRDSIRDLLFGGQSETSRYTSTDEADCGDGLPSQSLTNVPKDGEVKQVRLGVLGHVPSPTDVPDQAQTRPPESLTSDTEGPVALQERDALLAKLRKTVSRLKEEERYKPRPPASARSLVGPIRMDLLSSRLVSRARPGVSDEERKRLLGNKATRSFWKNKTLRKLVVSDRAERRRLRQKGLEMMEAPESSSSEREWKPFVS